MPDAEQLPVVVKANQGVGFSDIVGAGIGSGVGRAVGIADTVGCADSVGSEVGVGVGHVLHPVQSQLRLPPESRNPYPTESKRSAKLPSSILSQPVGPSIDKPMLAAQLARA